MPIILQNLELLTWTSSWQRFDARSFYQELNRPFDLWRSLISAAFHQSYPSTILLNLLCINSESFKVGKKWGDLICCSCDYNNPIKVNGTFMTCAFAMTLEASYCYFAVYKLLFMAEKHGLRLPQIWIVLLQGSICKSRGQRTVSCKGLYMQPVFRIGSKNNNL